MDVELQVLGESEPFSPRFSLVDISLVDKFLSVSPRIYLHRIDVAFRVDGYVVQPMELSRIVSVAPEAVQDAQILSRQH